MRSYPITQTGHWGLRGRYGKQKTRRGAGLLSVSLGGRDVALGLGGLEIVEQRLREV